MTQHTYIRYNINQPIGRQLIFQCAHNARPRKIDHSPGHHKSRSGSSVGRPLLGVADGLDCVIAESFPHLYIELQVVACVIFAGTFIGFPLPCLFASIIYLSSHW